MNKIIPQLVMTWSGLEPATGSEIMLLVLGGILTLIVGVVLIAFFIRKQMKGD